MGPRLRGDSGGGGRGIENSHWSNYICLQLSDENNRKDTV